MSAPDLVVAVLAALLGAAAGRAADALALVAPRPADGAAPARLDVRARSWGAPWPEFLGAVLGAATVLRFGWTAELPAWLWLAAVGLLLSLVDLRTMLLPNRVLLPGFAVGLLLLTVAAAVEGAWPSLGRALLAAGVAFSVLLVLALISPSGMGMGDVKLAGLLGLYLGWTGWPTVLLGLLLGFVLQAVIGVFLLVRGSAGRRTELPFGPSLIAGSLLAALVSGSFALVSG